MVREDVRLVTAGAKWWPKVGDGDYAGERETGTATAPDRAFWRGPRGAATLTSRTREATGERRDPERVHCPCQI